MAGWRLEVFRMMLYIAFPLGFFAVFTDPRIMRPLAIREFEKYPERMREMDPTYRALIQKDRDLKQFNAQRHSNSTEN